MIPFTYIQIKRQLQFLQYSQPFLVLMGTCAGQNIIGQVRPQQCRMIDLSIHFRSLHVFFVDSFKDCVYKHARKMNAAKSIQLFSIYRQSLSNSLNIVKEEIQGKKIQLFKKKIVLCKTCQTIFSSYGNNINNLLQEQEKLLPDKIQRLSIKIQFQQSKNYLSLHYVDLLNKIDRHIKSLYAEMEQQACNRAQYLDNKLQTINKCMRTGLNNIQKLLVQSFEKVETQDKDMLKWIISNLSNLAKHYSIQWPQPFPPYFKPRLEQEGLFGFLDKKQLKATYQDPNFLFQNQSQMAMPRLQKRSQHNIKGTLIIPTHVNRKFSVKLDSSPSIAKQFIPGKQLLAKNVPFHQDQVILRPQQVISRLQPVNNSPIQDRFASNSPFQQQTRQKTGINFSYGPPSVNVYQNLPMAVQHRNEQSVCSIREHIKGSGHDH